MKFYLSAIYTIGLTLIFIVSCGTQSENSSTFETNKKLKFVQGIKPIYYVCTDVVTWGIHSPNIKTGTKLKKIKSTDDLVKKAMANKKLVRAKKTKDGLSRINEPNTDLCRRTDTDEVYVVINSPKYKYFTYQCNNKGTYWEIDSSLKRPAAQILEPACISKQASIFNGAARYCTNLVCDSRSLNKKAYEVKEL